MAPLGLLDHLTRRTRVIATVRLPDPHNGVTIGAHRQPEIVPCPHAAVGKSHPARLSVRRRDLRTPFLLSASLCVRDRDAFPARSRAARADSLLGPSFPPRFHGRASRESGDR